MRNEVFHVIDEAQKLLYLFGIERSIREFLDFYGDMGLKTELAIFDSESEKINYGLGYDHFLL